MATDGAGFFTTNTFTGGADVASVFGRTGDIVAVSGDYNANQITDVFSAKTNGTASPYSILSTETNTYFTNLGATEEVYLNLPAATVGLVYKGVCVDSDLMRFVADGTETIRDGATVSGAGGFAQLAAIGSTVTLICAETGIWTVFSGSGNINVT